MLAAIVLRAIASRMHHAGNSAACTLQIQLAPLPAPPSAARAMQCPPPPPALAYPKQIPMAVEWRVGRCVGSS